MQRTEAKILSLPVAISAPEQLVAALLRSLALRAVLSTSSDDAMVAYELRERPDNFEVVRVDSTSCERIDIAESVAQAAGLIADDAHRWVAQHHSDLLMVHAGAVEWRGAGIVVPGRSYTGKTSLIAALLAAGARYLSDEFAPLDLQGNVHPYPRHLSLRDNQGNTSLVCASALGAETATEPVPVRAIIDAPYVAGATFSPARLRGAVPLMSLVDNALVARSRPAYTLAVIAQMTPNVVVLRSERGDAHETAALILDACTNSLHTT